MSQQHAQAHATPRLPRLRRNHLVRALIILVIVGVAALSAVSVYRASYVKEYLFKSLIQQGFAEIGSRFRNIVEPVTNALAVIRDWGREGQLDSGNTKALTERLMPVLGQIPQVSALMINDSLGGQYLLVRAEKGWLSRSTLSGDDATVQWRAWSGPRAVTDQWREAGGSDPRQEDWFLEIEKDGFSGRLDWFASHPLLGTDGQGISVSIGWRDQDQPGRGQAAMMEIPEGGLSGIVASTPVTGRGYTLVLDSEGELLAASAPDQASGELREADSDVVDRALASWKQRGTRFLDPYRFRHGGVDWWAGFEAFQLGDQGLWVGIVLPESEFLSRAGSNQNFFLAAVALVALLGIAATLLLGRGRKSAAVEAGSIVPTAADQERRLCALIDSGESERLEFKSTMRWNLGKDRAGKEVEMAWLKTVVAFLNSDGGTLLIGIADDGEIIGTEADRFASEDKYLLHVNNLLSQHIGTEYSHCLRFGLSTVSDKRVLVLECESCSAPVFLRINKEEEFYVRSGPASRKLPPSKLLSYVQARQSGSNT